jgi:HTH-type transcriptional regulator/antitoxin HipB
LRIVADRRLSCYVIERRHGFGMRVRTPTDLGLIIRERRRGLGLDQRTLASRVGVSRQWIVEVEQGKARAGIGLLLRTLAALGVALTTESGGSTDAPLENWVPGIDVDAVVDEARRRVADDGRKAPTAKTPQKRETAAASRRRRRRKRA